MKPKIAALLVLALSSFVAAGCSSAPDDDDASGEAAATSDEQALDEHAAVGDFIQTPFGLRHKSCVHEVPDESAIGDDGTTITRPDGSTFVLPRCEHAAPATSTPPPETNGWVASRSWWAPRWVRKMTASFNVPKAPHRQSGLVYLFPGLEPKSGTVIEQPVLAWGYGGPGWKIASWSCGDPCVHSPWRTVHTGDHLSGVMTGSDCSTGKCAWAVTTKDVTTGSMTTLHVPRQEAMFWVFGGVLEAYYIDTCDEYPAGSEVFSSLKVYDHALAQMTPSWSDDGNVYDAPHCGAKTSSTTGTVTISHMCKPKYESCTSGSQCCIGACNAGVCRLATDPL